MKGVPIFFVIIIVLSLALASASLTLGTCKSGEKCFEQALGQAASTIDTAKDTVKPLTLEQGNCKQPLDSESKCRFVENNYGCEYYYNQGKDSAVCYEEPFSNQADMNEYFNFKGMSLGPILEESTINLADLTDTSNPMDSFVSSAKKAGSWSYNKISEGYSGLKSGISWAKNKGWDVVVGGIKLVLTPVSWISDIFKSNDAQ